MDFPPLSISEYDQEDELLQISSFPGYQEAYQPDQLPLITSQDGCDVTHDGPKYKSSISYHETEKNPNDNSKSKKKITPREVERQRRHEMADLFTNLRSLIPVEYIKGKRSMSDQVNEAVNYIKHLQKKIPDLNSKRDELKRLSSFPRNATEKSLGSESDSVEIRPSGTGVEVVINAREGLPLSEVLEALTEEGLVGAGFISTRVNERMVHTIKAESSIFTAQWWPKHRSLPAAKEVRKLYNQLCRLNSENFGSENDQNQSHTC